ncbi:plastocyanin/azurin family copper-binding protein [Paenibacillus eucommiae]|uniref:Lipoprotein with Yx(FWY)xxD motif/plastocyanin n=1 Tax=Paenibacillus eucommiae TaxID=1355755 RepID=A0ABS4J0C4_9BACL|nr:plastocyanin/azurin family copper-binding protein [Paenibacillus eucommiae]MBP1993292.1 putative lipoprotein with Yx(FWY)xxD motif/plastocyanin [Paenibacillus eucommiae]
MIVKRFIVALLVIVLGAGFLPAFGASAQGHDAAVQTDAETAANLGLLLGDGGGVNATYLSKKSTRMQAAIISLRLQGLLEEAQAYTGMANFSDAGQVNKNNQAILAYLKNHPEYGWTGTGNGKFNPSEEISSQQLYKVLLEILGYQSENDFSYADTENFAEMKGLQQISGNSSLTNAHIATALVESLSVHTTSDVTLFAALQSKGVISASAMLPADQIVLRNNDKLGTIFTDKNGRTLYFFTKDVEDPNSCQDKCLSNWPIFYAEHLQIPGSLNAGDFSVLTRSDGTKQSTYKGWPLYYFVKDTAAGDIEGEGVGGVWFVAKADYSLMIGTSTALGNYFTDDYGRTLYYFDKDTKQKSVCEGTCLENWPAYTATGNMTPSTVTSSDLGSITRSDGSKQTTYKGYPLYYFVKDSKPGNLNGQNVNQVWFVIDPAKFTGTTGNTEATGTTGSPGTTETTGSQAKTYQIDIKEFSFGTEPLTVEAGSKVIFTNYDDMKHNAVAVDGSFATPLLGKGESYTITLDKVGTYDYFCEPHKQFMTGKIIVK